MVWKSQETHRCVVWPPWYDIRVLNAGMSATVVSRHFGCTRKIIEHLRKRFRVTGNVADHPRSGRPRVTTAADDRYIVLHHLRNRRLTTTTTGRQYGIHPQTVRNRLRQNVQPIRAYRPYFGQILTRRHRTARRDWCHRHLHFRRADWDSIFFSPMNVGLNFCCITAANDALMCFLTPNFLSKATENFPHMHQRREAKKTQKRTISPKRKFIANWDLFSIKYIRKNILKLPFFLACRS